MPADEVFRAMTTRRVHQNGVRVTVIHAVDLGADPNDPDARWYTVCESHGSMVGHPTRRSAEWHAPDPMGWCEECRSGSTQPMSTYC